MAWDFNRHHVAKKVLARHMDDLDRKQASISNRRDENLRDLQRELLNLQTVSTPDLRKDSDILRISRRRQEGMGRGVTSKSLNLPSPGLLRGVGTPPDNSRSGSGTHRQRSRLTSRRQSEPLAMGGRDVSEIQRMMSKAFNLSSETPDETWNNILKSTLPGTSTSTEDSSRLLKRRGTITQVEGVGTANPKLKEKVLKDEVAHSHTNPAASRIISRRGSLTLHDSDLKTVNEQNLSTKPKDVADNNLKTKKANFTFRRNSKTNLSSSLKKQNGVNVMFYNEETGEESIPTVPSLQLAEGDDISGADDSEGEEQEHVEGVWKDLARCRYIRGYDPPEMRTPKQDPATFVFGRDYNEVLQSQLETEQDN